MSINYYFNVRRKYNFGNKPGWEGIGIGQINFLKRYKSMEVELIFKIAAVGILVAVLNILLSRSGRDEQALMVTLAGLVCVLVIVVREISDLFSLIKDLFAL